MKVPFLDLKAHHAPLKEELMGALEEVIDCGAFAGGPFVEQFEKDFAEYCNTDHAIGVGSGTESLWLILKALDIGPGDEVITAPSTFFATTEAISNTGATPVLVDVCVDTCNLDPQKVEAAVTDKTKAIIPVHLFGQTADMDPIRTLAEAKGIYLVEDAAQAHGAEYNGQRAGSFGIAASFSFYPGKNLGAFGEAGAITTNDSGLDERIRMLRDHGQSQKYYHKLIGWNARMDGIQGAVLRIKLKHLEESIAKRNDVARRYNLALRDLSQVTLPATMADVRHVWHLYVIRIKNRNEVMKQLGERGVYCGIHYPVPVHLQEAYQSLNYKKGAFPVAERWADECLSLPMYPEMTNDQVNHVVNSLREVVNMTAS